MKKTLTCLLFLSLNCLYSTLCAQIELKLSPGNIIVNRLDVSGEIIFQEKYGVELTNGFAYGHFLGPINRMIGGNLKQSGHKIRIVGKYYFNPETIGDGLYLGPYVARNRFNIGTYDPSDKGRSKKSIAVGAIGGYKFFLGGNFFFNIEIGAGYLLNHRNEFGTILGLKILEWNVEFPNTIMVGYRF